VQLELPAQLRQLALVASAQGHRQRDDRDRAKQGEEGAGCDAARRT
jgi:hypothetical protein